MEGSGVKWLAFEVQLCFPQAVELRASGGEAIIVSSVVLEQGLITKYDCSVCIEE